MARILLIEDDPMVLYALAKALRHAGHDVIEAAHGGQQAVDDALPVVDAVVTDVVMPETEGLSVLLAAKRRRPDLPVVVISGGGRVPGRDYLNQAESLGADAVFAKPLDERDLIAEIGRLLERKRGDAGGSDT